MKLDEWHESQTHKAYNSLDCPHYAWEKAAWDSAVDEAVDLISTFIESVEKSIPQHEDFIYELSPQYDEINIANHLKEKMAEALSNLKEKSDEFSPSI